MPGFAQTFLQAAMGGYQTGLEIKKNQAYTDYLAQNTERTRIANEEARLPGRMREADRAAYNSLGKGGGGVAGPALPGMPGQPARAEGVVSPNDLAGSRAMGGSGGGMGGSVAQPEPSIWDKMQNGLKDIFGMSEPGGGTAQPGAIPVAGQEPPAEAAMRQVFTGQDLPNGEQLKAAANNLLPTRDPSAKMTAQDWENLADRTAQIYREQGLGEGAASEAYGKIMQSLQSATVRPLMQAAQAMAAGNPQEAAQLIDTYHEFTPDGYSAKTTVSPDGSLAVQLSDEKTGQPAGPPRTMTAQDVEALTMRLGNPDGWQKHVNESRKIDADIDQGQQAIDIQRDVGNANIAQSNAAVANMGRDDARADEQLKLAKTLNRAQIDNLNQDNIRGYAQLAITAAQAQAGITANAAATRHNKAAMGETVRMNDAQIRDIDSQIAARGRPKPLTAEQVSSIGDDIRNYEGKDPDDVTADPNLTMQRNKLAMFIAEQSLNTPNPIDGGIATAIAGPMVSALNKQPELAQMTRDAQTGQPIFYMVDPSGPKILPPEIGQLYFQKGEQARQTAASDARADEVLRQRVAGTGATAGTQATAPAGSSYSPRGGGAVAPMGGPAAKPPPKQAIPIGPPDRRYVPLQPSSRN